MKREEAIKTLTSLKEQYEIAVRATEHVGIKAGFKDAYDAINTAIAALRGPTREQVEKVWRSEWAYPACEWNLPKCPKCGCNSKDATYGHKNNFCPHCGAKMEDKSDD